jgi:hypothetical protein
LCIDLFDHFDIKSHRLYSLWSKWFKFPIANIGKSNKKGNEHS